MPDLDKRLEAKIRSLSSYYAKLARQRDLAEMLRQIRRPGWTTPAERLFAHTLLDSLNASAAGMLRSTKALAQAARAVGRGR